jgi:hypothetical protein
MSGQFAGDFGDLLPTACANFLGAVIVLFSSDPHYNCQTIVPQGTVITEVPLELAYSSYGPGHYEATVQISKEVKAEKEILLNQTLQYKSFKCRCGANHRQLSTSIKEFCVSKRCPSFKGGSTCQECCMCYNCEKSIKQEPNSLETSCDKIEW